MYVPQCLACRRCSINMWKLSGMAIQSKDTSSNSPHVCFFCCLYSVYHYLIFSWLFGTRFHCSFLSLEYKWTFVIMFTFTPCLNKTRTRCLEQQERYKINYQVCEMNEEIQILFSSTNSKLFNKLLYEVSASRETLRYSVFN